MAGARWYVLHRLHVLKPSQKRLVASSASVCVKVTPGLWTFSATESAEISVKPSPLDAARDAELVPFWVRHSDPPNSPKVL